MKHPHLVALGILTINALLFLLPHSPAQTSRPIVAQNYCTGTAAPGTLFALVAILPPGSAGQQLALPPMRCVQMDSTVFGVNAAGEVTVTIPVPPPLPVFLYDQPLTGTINGTNAVFTLPSAPSNPASLQIFRNGIKQLVGLDFSLSGATITFVGPGGNPNNPLGSIPGVGDVLVGNYQQ